MHQKIYGQSTLKLKGQCYNVLPERKILKYFKVIGKSRHEGLIVRTIAVIWKPAEAAAAATLSFFSFSLRN